MGYGDTRVKEDALKDYPALRRSKIVKPEVNLAATVFATLAKGSRTERVEAYKLIKEQVRYRYERNAVEEQKLKDRADGPGESVPSREKPMGQRALDLPRLQLMILRALLRPIGSSKNLKNSGEYDKYGYDVKLGAEDPSQEWTKFCNAIEGSGWDAREAADSRGDNPLREFSNLADGKEVPRSWLLPALGFLGSVQAELPDGTDSRRLCFRLLIAYTLDPRDSENASSFAIADDTEQRPKFNKMVRPTPVKDGSTERETLQHNVDVAAFEFAKFEKENDPKKTSRRTHLRSKLAYHALDGILHGAGFSARQRWAAISVVLGDDVLKALNDSDWYELAFGEKKSSGILPIQWLCLLWMVAQEDGIDCPELGIVIVVDPSKPFVPFSEIWNRAGKLWTLIKAVFDATQRLHPKDATTLDVLVLPFGLVDSLAYIFPKSLIEPWIATCELAVRRDVSPTSWWSDREIIRHFLILRAGREGQGGGIQSAVAKLPRNEQIVTRRRIAAVLTDYLARLSRLDHQCWAGCTQMVWESLRANVRYSEPERKADVLRPVALQLSSENSTFEREAILTLLEIGGAAVAIRELVAVAVVASVDTIEMLASSLKLTAAGNAHLKTAIVDELESWMHAGKSDEEAAAARTFISEMGGSVAYKKLTLRSSIGAQYTALMEKTGDQVQEMFHRSIQDARLGFFVAMLMDVVLFCVGIGLIILSVVSALLNNSGANNVTWEGTGISGGAGLLAIAYSAFISKPRKQVKAATDHITGIKIVFLGYLRELGHVDQAFTRRLMEDGHIEQSELESYSQILERIMRETTARMREMSKATDKQLEAAAADPPALGLAPAAEVASRAQAIGGGAIRLFGGLVSSRVSPLPAVTDTGDGDDVGSFKAALQDVQMRLQACGTDLDAAATAVAQAAESPFSILMAMLHTVEAAFEATRQRLRLAVGCAAANSRLPIAGRAEAAGRPGTGPVSDAVLQRLVPSGFEGYEQYGAPTGLSAVVARMDV